MAVARGPRQEGRRELQRQETHVGLRHHPKAVGESDAEKLTSSRGDGFEAGDALTPVAARWRLRNSPWMTLKT